MNRYVMPALLLIALVAGYVVGQQPGSGPTSGNGIGRYQLDGEHMLDTSTGKLFRLAGNDWEPVVK